MGHTEQVACFLEVCSLAYIRKGFNPYKAAYKTPQDYTFPRWCALSVTTGDTKLKGRTHPKTILGTEMVGQRKQDNGRNAMFCSWNQKNYRGKRCVHQAEQSIERVS